MSQKQFAGIDHKPLTGDQITAALLSPVVFCDQHCWIRGRGGAPERFRIVPPVGWAYQEEVMQCFDEESRVLVLKARQLGISWLADAYALWLCTANRGQTVIILSQGQRESKEEMRRIRFMHERLPPELRRRTGLEVTDTHAPDTTEHLEFPDTDSRILSLPSTEHAGTSFTATLVIIHELAKIQTAGNLIAAITPTMADSGRMFVVSTAFGFSGTFYDYWKEHGVRWHTGQIVGDKGTEGSYRPVFIPWHARPRRTQAWYDQTKRSLTRESMMKQEYPATPTEAFQGTAEAVFAEEFDRHYHTVDGSRHDGSNYEVVACADLGINHAYGYLIEIQGSTAFVFAEVHIENGTVEELGEAMFNLMAEHGLVPADILCYPDPAGVARNMQTLQTDMDVLKECGLLIDDSGTKVSPAQRVDILKKLMKHNRFWVSLDCPDLVDACEKAQWKRRRAPSGNMVKDDTYEKDGKYEHPLDAVGYGISRIFPPFTAAAVNTDPPQPLGSNNVGAMASYSGSEFGG